MLKFKEQKCQEPPKQDYWKWHNLKKEYFWNFVKPFLTDKGFMDSPYIILKSDCLFPNKIVLFVSMKALQKMMKNTFYFIVKALLFLQLFKFLS